VILDQFVSTTGYSRWYVRFVLRHEDRRVQADKQTMAGWRAEIRVLWYSASEVGATGVYRSELHDAGQSFTLRLLIGEGLAQATPVLLPHLNGSRDLAKRSGIPAGALFLCSLHRSVAEGAGRAPSESDPEPMR
jgi:hypothetical protein